MEARLFPTATLMILLSGCTAGSTPSAEPDDLPTTSTPEALLTSFMGDGTLALGNCWDGPLGTSCVFNIGNPVANNQAGNIIHVPIAEAKGTIDGASATLTWDPSSPLTETLELRFSVLEGCPDSCSTHHVVETATGGSPLTLEIPAMT